MNMDFGRELATREMDDKIIGTRQVRMGPGGMLGAMNDEGGRPGAKLGCGCKLHETEIAKDTRVKT